MRTDKIQKINLSKSGVYLRHYGVDAAFDALAQQAAERGGRIREKLIPMILCPGGGYFIIGTTEAWPVADVFLHAGFYPFILSYTVSEKEIPFDPAAPQDYAPFADFEEGVAAVRAFAAREGCFTDQLLAVGFSAGAHVALGSLALRGGNFEPPTALILSYPLVRWRVFEHAGFDLLAHIPKGFPPTFLWHGLNDAMVNPASSFQLADILREKEIPSEFHCYEEICHADPFYEPAWIPAALQWLARRF
ncbi:MAG: hypothetical protein LBR14_02640 [Clostridiales Family XIII bacterium]|jgi:acetyl esterase/lipase|nr:hypothetical protein [Clostridiales Family XIII bacterium]